MDVKTQDRIMTLIKKEVVPATGCTEPVAVALAVAHAAATLPTPLMEPSRIEVLLSANMLKNAMGVGIPGTGMIGLPIAIALGYVIAKPEKGLSILNDFSPEELERAKGIVARGNVIAIDLKPGDVDNLYIEVNLQATPHQSTSVIERTHTGLTTLLLDGKVLPTHSSAQTSEHPQDGDVSSTDVAEEDIELNFDTVYRFATEAPLEKIAFIEEAAKLNSAVSASSLQREYGHSVGRMIQGPLGKKYLGDSVLSKMLSYTSAACDARMDGAPMAVMSNSGSGNQGITATLPVVSFAQDEGADHEKTIRALMLSNLMVVYIKQKLGRLSALCGCVVAATGSACGITYLMGGSKQQIGFAIKNMVGNITGMLCDGAKPSCALKVTSGVSSAMLSAILAMDSKVVTASEGIVDDDVDRTVDNLTSIGREAMRETDKHVLNIMTHKQKSK
ncbi:membrane protein [Porphyromonas crevioricanis]|uniref:UPF0597 protein HQ38_07625 n=2 Tax=Porphyromonas crevioricanis TaxID=393921 RepID=A0A0A2FKB5_9PORP|nr:L-serine ammonia-lyase, iron-sulfur-dependent, subunit alpha [Porphyromonas crevioricanis]KGN88754.1 membrane protein [Porphyromonas crevioricanis]KGN93876.1 membrane protein [Porphyromonas crevioricanis]SJZ88668.1 L-cysteine desulfidase [Porphyromonas crevioricanis]SQH73629.1 Serine dehydratase alpha chain [Porphyromonas crevioricanis]GAD05459.1 putative inner membrane protein [Porphyromonas crevioricanis JCM 15906]